MAQLLLTVEDCPKKCFPKDFQQLEKRQLVVKLSNELHTKMCSTKSPERPTKKMKKSNYTQYAHCIHHS